VANASKSGHESTDSSPSPGVTAAGKAAIVGKRFGKTHADACSYGRRKANAEGIPTAVGCKRGRKYGRERGNRTIHQSREPRLNDLEYKRPPARLVFVEADFRLQFIFFESYGPFFVVPLFLDEIIEQLTGARVVGAFRRSFVEATAFHFHHACLFANVIKREGSREPDGLAREEAFDVLAAYERNVFAELLTEQIDQATAVAGLFFAHTVENRGRRRKVMAEAFGVVGVDAFVFFFERNGKSQNFAFGQIVESAHMLINV